MSKEKGFWPVIFLTLVVIIAIAALSVTDGITRDKIAQAKQDEVMVMLSTLFPDMQSFTYNSETNIYEAVAGEKTIGYAFIAQAQGYGGVIDILVGMKPDNRSLEGIRIIAQQETPGLGAKISNPEFFGQFSGVAVDEIALSRNGGKIDAITGATISSTAVVKAVKDAVTRQTAGHNGEEGS